MNKLYCIQMLYKSYAQNPPPLTNSTPPTCKYLAGQLAGNVFKKTINVFLSLAAARQVDLCTTICFIYFAWLPGWVGIYQTLHVICTRRANNCSYKVSSCGQANGHVKQVFHAPENWQGEKQWAVYVLSRLV